MSAATRTLLVVIALFIGTASVTARKKCSATQMTACMNCSQIGTCGTDLTLTAAATCSSSQVCQEFGNTALCVTANSTNVCNNCGSLATACDPYDTRIVHACIPGQAPLPVQECPDTQMCSAGACVDKTSLSGLKSPAEVCAENIDPLKFYSLKPACTSAVLCSGTNVIFIYNCTSGNYFNQISNTCRSLPVNHCEGVTTDGIYAHLTNCSNGVVCIGGALTDEIQCGFDMAFSVTHGCAMKDDTSVCPVMDGCTTTIQPAVCSASNLNMRYPHETKCERYYTCRLRRGTYKFVESTCRGNLVYNPTTTKCETPTLPSCRTSRNDAA
ncbi:uncharacterized protein LOC108683420 [Hyalella azteca]|uniref:Uncharacterized protein LOC108683420 n=1 Tax=Hyalella azteca TaxID=294128 RepID=A0A8B7PPT9_HYAAZ|nr:uncharacterized protein LOC108683420 [Hyalella azteca]